MKSPLPSFAGLKATGAERRAAALPQPATWLDSDEVRLFVRAWLFGFIIVLMLLG